MSDYEFVHDCERITLEHQKELGEDDVSKCLPGWVKTLCEKFTEGNGCILSKHAVEALAHTLIAARKRQHRLIAERDRHKSLATDEHALKLLDNGWTIQLFKNGLGSYTAIGIPASGEVSHDDRYLTDDFTPGKAIHRLAEKCLLGNILASGE